jgi:hypothetical protein
VSAERERDSAEGIGGESLLNFGLLACLAPMLGREFEDAALGPVGQQAEEVPQVSPGLELVLLAPGQRWGTGPVAGAASVRQSPA